jgi:uncharacterized protein YbaR (Trm112 family)/SAM-dependent methyltransferase
MKASFLELLRCPFCGGRLTLQGTNQDGMHSTGILCCQCCAYPMVEGIPYLRTGTAAEVALRQIGQEQSEHALFTLLGLPEGQRQPFKRLLQREQPATFRDCLSLLCPGPEGDYLFHRFSDPTFLCSQLVLRALAQDRRCMAGPVLDICGATGHLTLSLCETAQDVILSDLSFAKLWLARRFLAPGCQPVCCDASEPLPFAPRTFSFVLCSDAFHYVWRRRLLACEMVRLIGEAGTILLTHLHNLLVENISAGMPLTPASYQELFADLEPRIFKESSVFEALLTRQPLDLSAGCADEELNEEAALILLATRLPLFRVYEIPPHPEANLPLVRNPLYAVERDGDGEVWTLRFPSTEYASEYANCLRYLPPTARLNRQDLDDLRQGSNTDKLKELARRHVLLELPSVTSNWIPGTSCESH